MRFQQIVRTSEGVTAAPGRLEKVRLLAELLTRAAPEEAAVVAPWLAGELREGRIGVGPASLSEVSDTPPVKASALSVAEVDAAFAELAAVGGAGSTAERRRQLRELFARATLEEQRFLARLLLGELRQGAQQALVLEALARVLAVPAARVRRAVMLVGDPWKAAGELLREGGDGVPDMSVRLFRPVRPMLAQGAEDVEEALSRLERAAFEYKVDGARIQGHKRGDEVRVYTRRLNEVTAAVPDVVATLRGLEADEAIVDGEAICLGPDGRPRPFQETMRRFGRVRDVESLRRRLPLSIFLFDCLLRDGRPLVDRSAEERHAALAEVAPAGLRVPRTVTAEPDVASSFHRQAIAAGHEGLLAKALDAPYTAGRRGRSWLKVKRVRTADLVVLAAEWGHGRRRGWLSNLHLGAREPAGGFAMVGKTFKGMTDRMLEWQTARLLELERDRDRHVVRVRPELVVEVAFDGVQRSPRYRSGLALRFARVRGYREDKTPAEADTLEMLRRFRDGPGAGRRPRAGGRGMARVEQGTLALDEDG